ncbi:TraX family protein [Butyrivibrio hungatei]|uniref:TraX family protein n=1 Tax=Butyrivibrio hungatei TaxID=185008 RepID=A0A1D9P054_9FIRM|nr:TraX family protein [Butyrivibrio hungatei]AOZ95892.1 TraX family protein [Butyrivibrio hungatei]
MKNLLKKGLTGFELKYLALIFMVLDHIHYFFEFTGMIPIWFSWLGRLAAPLFLFCLVEGFTHTHDKKKYFLKIYSISIIMGLIRFGFYNVLDFAVRGDGFIPANAMLTSFVVLLVVLMGIELIRQKKFLIGILAVVIPVILPYLFIYFVYIPYTDNHTVNILASLINFTILPLHTMIQDGGTLTLIEGMILYLFSFCKNKNARIYAFVIFELLYGIGLVSLAIGSFNVHTLIFEAYEWMSVFSAIFMLCYNGERGHGNSRFFYLFYPAHIYVLYGISLIAYALF